MYRVEDKFLVSERELYLLQSRLKVVLNTDRHSINGYTITSVYFDDFCDSCLQDTIDGNRIRQKYRIRIYDGSFDVIKLEVKYKRDNRVKKCATEITYEQMCDLMRGICIEEGQSSVDDPITLFNMEIKERGLRPKAIVEYDRMAYVFALGNVRITLDRDLRVSRRFDAFMRKECICPKAVLHENRVLEIKYDEFLPDFIAGILEYGNMLQTSFSKYRICREENTYTRQ